MNMRWIVLSRLLSQTNYLLLSGYVAFIVSTTLLLFYGASSLQYWLLLTLNFLALFIHHYVSLRVKFDADLLQSLSQYQLSQKISSDQLAQQFDQTMLDLKLMPARKIGRSWDNRFQGCLKLFKIQILLLIIQYILLIVLIGLFSEY